jgi:WD40 repeat protein
MTPSAPGPAPLVNWFTMPVEAAAFSGIPGITGMALLPKAGVLLAAAMNRRVIACDLKAPIPAVKELVGPPRPTGPGAVALKRAAAAPQEPTIPARFHDWAHDNWIHDIAVHPDGVRVATCGYDRHVKVWRWGQDKPLFDLAAHEDWVRVVAFSPDGKLLASAGDDGTARLWDAATGKAVSSLRGGDYLDALAWTPDSKRLLISGNDGILRVWEVGSPDARTVDVSNRREIEDEPLNGGFSYPGGVRGLAVSPDGRSVAAAGLYSLVVLDLNTLKKTLEIPGRAFGVAYSPDGGRIAFSQEQDLLVYDLGTKQVRHKIMVKQLGQFALFFLDGGKRLTAAGCNGRVGLWEVPS